MTTNIRRGSALATALLATTSLTCLAPALAQDGGEEVVVTAQKREQKLQKVPVSVQALGTKKLEDLHVQDFASYVKYLPSVTYAVGGGGGTPVGPGFATVTMRGVASGGDGNHSGSLPTVGIYLDEQPVTTIGGSPDIHIYDIARVEALSGPQGTLYGASSLAGTLRIITNKPNPDEFSASYDLELNSVSHGDIGYTAEGYVNVPVAEGVAVRLVGWYERDAGYIDNVPGTRTYPTSGVTIDNDEFVEDDYNSAETYGARLAVGIDLNENWTVTPTIMGQVTHADGFFAYDPNVGDLKVRHYVPEYANDKWFQAALTVEGKISNFDIVYSGGHMERVIDSASDYTDYSFFYDTLYGYGAYIYDNSGTPIDPTQYITGHDKFKKDSHELRIASPADERFRFVAGLFYQRQERGIEQNYLINGIADSIAVLPNQIWLTDQIRIDKDYAVFGEISYDVTEKLTLTGGLRGFKADNSIKGFFGFSDGYSSRTGVAACFTPFVPFRSAPCTNLDRGVKEDGVTWKVNASYEIDDDRMVYATVSTGYRPPGINRRAGQLPVYDSDTLTNYEVGWKTAWNDGGLIFNGAVFWQEWKDFQFSFLGENSFTEIRNAGDARIYGIEADFVWRPAGGLTLSGSASYINTELSQDYCGVINPATGESVAICPGPDDPNQPDAPKGQELPTTPDFKMSMVARYEFPVGDATAHVQGSLTYQTSSWPDLRNGTLNGVTGEWEPIRSVLGKLGDFATVDLAAGMEWGNSTAELFVENLTDERAELYRFSACNVLVCGNNPYDATNRPLTVGVKFGQHF
jgi:outer membrane receptor protein involved in Fe transport